jgi:hypothetical protein
MPWKECHKMDERVRFVSRHLEGRVFPSSAASLVFPVLRATNWLIATSNME